MRPKVRSVEEVLADIARTAHGVVTRTEALDAGITEAELKHRVATGALIRVHRAVYRVGHTAPSIEADYLAAVRACGDDALLSGRAAAYLHGLILGSAPKPEVTAPTDRRVRGVRTRKCQLEANNRTRCRGIPVTTVEHTLVDIAPTLSLDELARACHEAGVRYRTKPAEVEAVLARWPTAPGSRKLRKILSGDVHVTLSKTERRFLELLQKAGLPLPQTNRVAGGRRVDCRWPSLALTVELDSYRYHSSRHAYEQDRKREREARARGDDFRRFTYGDVFERPTQLLAELRPVLSAD